MPDYLIVMVIVYISVAFIIWLFLLGGIDKYDELVTRYGMYRGITLEVIIRTAIAIFWLPYALFFYIVGLIKGE